MIDWIAMHPEIILYLCISMIALILAGAMTYCLWCLISDHLRLKDEHNQVMADYRRNKALIDDYMAQPLGQAPDEETEEVLRRLI